MFVVKGENEIVKPMHLVHKLENHIKNILIFHIFTNKFPDCPMLSLSPKKPSRNLFSDILQKVVTIIYAFYSRNIEQQYSRAHYS